MSSDSNDDFVDPLGAKDSLGQSLEDDFEEFNIDVYTFIFIWFLLVAPRPFII